MLRRTLALAAAGLAATVVAACGDAGANPAAEGKVDVVVAFYPLQFVAERVGGDAVAVTNLAKPGAEPHDLELSPEQVGEVSDAGLIVYLKGFQPQVDEAIAQQGGDRAFDVATVTPLRDAAEDAHVHEGEPGGEHAEEAGGKDPHVWLDPTRLADDRRRARRAPRRDRPGGRRRVHRAGPRRCGPTWRRSTRSSATGSPPASAARSSPATPRSGTWPPGTTWTRSASPACRRRPSRPRSASRRWPRRPGSTGATTIFFETLVSPKVAETIATEVGAETAVLDPIEGLQPGSTGDYLSVMRSNLAVLRPALGCS